jgi:hypothetical protein
VSENLEISTFSGFFTMLNNLFFISIPSFLAALPSALFTVVWLQQKTPLLHSKGTLQRSLLTLWLIPSE